MLTANVIWGLMSPVTKFVFLGSAVTPILMVDFRVVFAAILFWITSLFTKQEHVPHKDLLKLFFAALFGVVFNQGLFTVGLGMTSPVDASIITTSTPILTMIIAAYYLKEPVTAKKILGVFLGACGALMLILSSSNVSGGNAQEGNIWGDVICILAEVCFAVYLVMFKGLISRYSPVTLMKWMFTYTSICIIPFSYTELAALDWASVSVTVWGAVAFVVVGATYLSYLLVPVAQRNLRPTVVSMYCYVQPVVATCYVAVCWGMESFGILKGIAVAAIFSGVFLVTQSKSRAQMEAYEQARMEKQGNNPE